MYLKRGLKKTIQAVKEHKILFILLIVIQLIFLISCSYLIVTYQVKIMQNAQDITQALENANYDPNAIQLGGQFMKDISLVYDNYNNMMEFITQFILWIFGLFILFNGLIWLGAHYMLRKTAVIKVAVKFFVATLVMISPLLIIFYYILSKYVTAIWVNILPENVSPGEYSLPI